MLKNEGEERKKVPEAKSETNQLDKFRSLL